MSKKITFLVMSDRKGVVRRIVLSNTNLKLLAVTGFVLVILFSSLIVDYAGLLFQDLESKHLKVENRQLKNDLEVVTSKLTTLEGNLDQIQTFTAKLKMITDIKDDDRQLNLAIGPVKKVEEMASDDLQQEPVYEKTNFEEAKNVLEKPILDSSRGELAQSSNVGYRSLSVRIDRAIKHAQIRQQGVLELWETLSVRQSLLRATPSISPTRGWKSSLFGYRTSSQTGRLDLHPGVDIAAPTGTPVYATADGIVSFSGYDGSYGKLVSIDHGYGLVTRFGHNSEVFVNVGQKVKRGDVIAAVGNTGRSTASHLHYEVRVNNLPVDPENYILNFSQN